MAKLRHGVCELEIHEENFQLTVEADNFVKNLEILIREEKYDADFMYNSDVTANWMESQLLARCVLDCNNTF